MTNVKKLLAFLLVVCVVVGVTACGSPKTTTDESKTKTSTSKETTETTSKTETAEEVDIWAAYPETVTLTTAITATAGNVGFVEGEDYQNNPWHTAWKERFNVDVQNVWTVESGSDYKTKLNLSIADNDLPEVFSVSDIATLQQLIDAGIAMDITEVFDTYASDTVKGYMETLPEVVATACKDGKMYAVPLLSYGYISTPRELWIRKDWKEAQNIEAPKTYDDFVEILRTFNKEYGAVLGETSSLAYMNTLAPMWNAYPTAWLRTENGVEYGGIQPEMKDVLLAYKELYDEGLLYDEFMVSDDSKVIDMCASGKIGMIQQVSWFDYYFTSTLEINGPESYFEAYELPTVSGEPFKYVFGLSNNGYTVINSKCKNPEAAIKLINYFAKVVFEGDEEEGLYEELSRVNNVVAGCFRVFDPNCDYNQHVDILEALESGDSSKLVGSGTITKYENCLKWIENKDVAGLFNYFQVGDPEVSGYAVAKKVLDEGNYFYNVLWGITPETLLNTGSVLSDLLLQGYTKIIVGEEPIEYFDELVASWKAAGGEQATKEMNELYQ